MSAACGTTNRRLLKICPGCAMAHLAKCSKVTERPPSGGEVVVAEANPHCRLTCLLKSSKQLCGVSGELTLMHLVLLLSQVVLIASSAVLRLAGALLPVSRYLLLVLIYALECFSWVWAEDQLYLKVLKGLASLACLIVLVYTAHVIVASFVKPTIALILTLFLKGYYLI